MLAVLLEANIWEYYCKPEIEQVNNSEGSAVQILCPAFKVQLKLFAENIYTDALFLSHMYAAN